jgi:hypothetical protein
MPFDMHTVEVLDGSSQTNRTDRIQVAFLPSQATPAASGAGASVTLNVTGQTLPSTPYAVHALPSIPAIVSVSAKTNTGFVLTLTPLTTGTTLAASAVDVVVFA